MTGSDCCTPDGPVRRGDAGLEILKIPIPASAAANGWHDPLRMAIGPFAAEQRAHVESEHESRYHDRDRVHVGAQGDKRNRSTHLVNQPARAFRSSPYARTCVIACESDRLLEPKDGHNRCRLFFFARTYLKTVSAASRWKPAGRNPGNWPDEIPNAPAFAAATAARRRSARPANAAYSVAVGARPGSSV